MPLCAAFLWHALRKCAVSWPQHAVQSQSKSRTATRSCHYVRGLRVMFCNLHTNARVRIPHSVSVQQVLAANQLPVHRSPMEIRHRGSMSTEASGPGPDAIPLKPDLHGVLQHRLRSVSQESDELLMYTPTAIQGTQMPELMRETSPIKESKVEGVPSLKSKVKDLHDDLENWGYHNYPVITDHFNFLVYGIDLAVRSVRWFQFGFAACWLGFRLCVYAIMLLPAFVRIMLTYYHDTRIHRRIRFGPAEREYLDIYVPKEATKEGAKVPVVVAIMGGAFIIGHRGYNAQLGLRLMDFGIITVGIDYRNFPRGSIPDMDALQSVRIGSTLNKFLAVG